MEVSSGAREYIFVSDIGSCQYLLHIARNILCQFFLNLVLVQHTEGFSQGVDEPLLAGRNQQLVKTNLTQRPRGRQTRGRIFIFLVLSLAWHDCAITHIFWIFEI